MKLERGVQASIERLVQRVRWGVMAGGLLPGRGAGRRLGSAGEFEGYRRYEPGDDLRGLDIQVYRRLRRPMVRMLREDSIIPLTLLIDRSGSMAGVERPRAVAELALFFLLLGRRAGDPLRLFGFRDGQLLKPRSHSREIAARLGSLLECYPPQGASHFQRAFRSLPPHPSGHGIVLVISDAFGIADPDAELAPLVRTGRLFWIAPLEVEEREPSSAGSVILESREPEPSWEGTLDASTTEQYCAHLARYHEGLRRRLLEWGGDFYGVPAENSIVESIGWIQRGGRLLR
ncbi:MAG: DUF58 domain-containing protein [Planctomycetota bacterium]